MRRTAPNQSGTGTVTLSGSANLKGAAWTANVAQYEELVHRDDRRRLVKLQTRAGRLVGQLAASRTREAPAYVAITNDE